MHPLARAGARAGAILLGAVAVLALSAPQAAAHIRSTNGSAVLHSTGSGADLRLSLEYEILARAAGLGADAIDARDDTARAEALSARTAALAGYLDERVNLSVDGVGCASSLATTGIETRRGISYARLTLVFACPGPERGSYTFDYDVFGPTDGVVDDHILTLDYDLGGLSGETFLNRAYSTMTVGEPSSIGTSARFAGFGATHLLSGLDHVLFVVALLLGTRRLTDLLRVASVFAFAHSVTLGMAAAGWVDLPASVVEPLIALSIVYVAVDNVVSGPSPPRLGIVAGGGLLHGLGFAESLDIAGAGTWGRIGSLLSFNLGIELGLALLVLVAFPTLLLVRRLRWSVGALAGATSFVSLIGLVWFFERVTVT